MKWFIASDIHGSEYYCRKMIDSFEKEIAYNNLSTGQKKTVDIAIVFGILQNVISNVDMNVLVMDELMSNMDSDARNVMLSVLKETMGEDKSIFIDSNTAKSLKPVIAIATQKRIEFI